MEGVNSSCRRGSVYDVVRQGVQAALFAFPLVTADELRVALRVLRQPDPSPSDLSRALAYLEEVGMLHEAPATVADAYWRHRRTGRRPLRLYLSVPHQAVHWEGEFRSLGVQKVDIGDWTYVAEIDRALTGEISEGIRASIGDWKKYARALRTRGLRTIWQPCQGTDASSGSESDPPESRGAEHGPQEG